MRLVIGVVVAAGLGIAVWYFGLRQQEMAETSEAAVSSPPAAEWRPASTLTCAGASVDSPAGAVITSPRVPMWNFEATDSKIACECNWSNTAVASFPAYDVSIFLPPGWTSAKSVTSNT